MPGEAISFIALLYSLKKSLVSVTAIYLKEKSSIRSSTNSFCCTLLQCTFIFRSSLFARSKFYALRQNSICSSVLCNCKYLVKPDKNTNLVKSRLVILLLILHIDLVISLACLRAQPNAIYLCFVKLKTDCVGWESGLLQSISYFHFS